MPPKKGGKAAGGGAQAQAPQEAASTGAAGAPSTGPVLTWTGEVHATNTVPGRCSAVAALEDQKLLVFGGWAGGTAGHVNPIHQLDLSTATWLELEATGEPHIGTSQAAAADVVGG